jgi:predicted CXXCH cytochrome family protein
MNRILIPLLLLMITAPAADASVRDTVHNLSVGGPGTVKSLSETRICIFCHAPHQASPSGPLWNKADSDLQYDLYASSTLLSTPEQPSGSSKLCLSCHDGTIALGSLLYTSEAGTDLPMTQDYTTGDALIGQLLADDHPVSIAYTDQLADLHGELAQPADVVNAGLSLEAGGMLQCGACHDAHDNSLGMFLRMDNSDSGLCLTCHQPTHWVGSGHESTNPGVNCLDCHRGHGAAWPVRNLAGVDDEVLCLGCHDGSPAADVAAAFQKSYTHPMTHLMSDHDPVEDPYTMGEHTTCLDCHEPHAALPISAGAGALPGPLNGMPGLDIAGAPVAEAQAGFEVCFRCHGTGLVDQPSVNRLFPEIHVRDSFQTSNESFHPLAGPGANPNVPSLLPPWTENSTVTCGDCHANPDSENGEAAGPHGSNYPYLFVANYEMNDGSIESEATYALCYRCHDRQSILNDESFEHMEHIDEDLACASCHSGHGVGASQSGLGDRTHLINFNLDVVEPYNDEIWFQDDGQFHGTCNLRCHGKDHESEDY